MSTASLVNVVEVLLLGAGRALTLEELVALLADSPLSAERAAVRDALDELRTQYAKRGLELTEVASGYRLQIGAEYAPWIGRLWAERPQRYSRALLETLALVAYRQPITRGEIEDVRGVSVSASIVRTLLERDWIRVIGHRDVPGRPAIYGTTRTFLDDFNLTGLEDLPPLAEVRDIDRFHDDLFNEQGEETPDAAAEETDAADRPDAADETDAAESPDAADETDAADGISDGDVPNSPTSFGADAATAALPGARPDGPNAPDDAGAGADDGSRRAPGGNLGTDAPAATDEDTDGVKSSAGS